jgi:hypothetical protein
MSHQILPEHIRASLAQYSKHQQCTCLHCGYSGLMGVHREEENVSNSKATKIYAIILTPIILWDLYLAMKGLPLLPWWIILIVMIGVMIYQVISKQVYLTCPNCNTELKIN